MLDGPAGIGPLCFTHPRTAVHCGVERVREQQAALVVRQIETLVTMQPMPVMVAEDFDAPPGAVSLRCWRRRQALHRERVAYLDGWAAHRLQLRAMHGAWADARCVAV